MPLASASPLKKSWRPSAPLWLVTVSVLPFTVTEPSSLPSAGPPMLAEKMESPTSTMLSWVVALPPPASVKVSSSFPSWTTSSRKVPFSSITWADTPAIASMLAARSVRLFEVV